MAGHCCVRQRTERTGRSAEAEDSHSVLLTAEKVALAEIEYGYTGKAADAKLGKEIGAAKKDAAADKLDADYKVAIEKCDALAGDAKSSCVAAAKAKFGKT